MVFCAQELWNTSAIDLLQRFLEKDPGLDVIVTSPEYSTAAAVRAIQRGASDFMAKPLDASKLRQKIFSLVGEASSRRRTLELSHQLLRECQLEGIIAKPGDAGCVCQGSPARSSLSECATYGRNWNRQGNGGTRAAPPKSLPQAGLLWCAPVRC